MLFSELYGAYYNTVACIINKAISHPIKSTQIEEIIKEYAFSDSFLEISQAIRKQNWKVLRSDGTTPIKNAPTMPLTILEKRWLKAIKDDPRIRLFLDEPSEFDFDDVEPLFFVLPLPAPASTSTGPFTEKTAFCCCSFKELKYV